MQLTQKHFQFIAKVLSEISSDATWSNVVEKFAQELVATNPKFKRDLFLKECGMELAADFTIRNEGSIFLFHPKTAQAEQWIEDHIPHGAQFFGKAVVVEYRYAHDLTDAIVNDGLSVQGE